MIKSRQLTVIDKGKCSDLDEGLWESLYDDYICWKHRFLLTRGHRSLIIDSHTHGLKYNSSLGNSLSFDLDSVITKDMYDKTDIYGNNPVGEGCTLSWISDKTETWKNIANDETTNIYPSKLPNEDCIIPSLAEWTDISQNKIQHGVNALSCEDISDINPWPNFYIKKNSISQNARVVPRLKANDKLRPLGLTSTRRSNEIALENGVLEVKLNEASKLSGYIGRTVNYNIHYNQRKLCVSKAPLCNKMYTIDENGNEN